MKNTLLYLSLLSLTACAATSGNTPSSPVLPTQPQPQTQTASDPALPYPEPEHSEQIDLLGIQVSKMQQQIEQLEARVQQLETRNPTRAVPAKPKKRMLRKSQMPVSFPVSGDLKTPADTAFAAAQKYYRQGNWHAAAQTLRYADSGGDGSENARQSMYLLLQSQQHLGNCQSVINIGQRYASHFAHTTTVPEALFAVGQCQWQIQQQDIAKDTWRNLIRLYPKSAAAHRAAAKLKTR